MKYYIYKITNTINGKCYIGQHKLKENEWPRGYMGRGLAIQAAYKKYGRSNFVKEILEEIEDDDKRKIVSEREKYWIQKLNTMEPNGYNRHPGGIGGCTKESAQKIVETKRKNGTINHSDETKKKMSQAALGKVFSDTHKQHLSENHHARTKRVIIFEDGHTEETFESMANIAKRFDTNQNSLIRHSAKDQFINGVKIEGVNADKYACCKNEDKSKYIKCYDPIKNDNCTLRLLRLRKFKKPEMYKNIDPKEQIIIE